MMAFLGINQGIISLDRIARSVSLFNLDHSFEELLPQLISQD